MEVYNAQMQNGTWELVPRPPDANIMKLKWLWKVKKDEIRRVRHKARLVILGCMEVYGVDNDEIFAPVFFSDNEGAVCLMERPAKHSRTKQISICYLKIREYIKERGVIVKRVASKDNIADIQTKPLAKLLLDKFKAMLGIKRVQPESCD